MPARPSKPDSAVRLAGPADWSVGAKRRPAGAIGRVFVAVANADAQHMSRKPHAVANALVNTHGKRNHIRARGRYA